MSTTTRATAAIQGHQGNVGRPSPSCEGQLRDEREGHKATSRQLSATKGQLTKTRKRAAAALCPAGCKRHFVQMERHLQSKHPQWSPETSNALESR